MKKSTYFLSLFFMAVLCFPWSSSVLAEELTVASRTTTNAYVPLYCSYGDGVGTKSQFIYPKEMLSDLEGTNLSAIVFHADKNITWSNGGTVPTFAVRLKEVDETSLTAFVSSATLTEVYYGQPEKGIADLAFEFDNSFAYIEGKNLLVEVEVVVAGGWQSGVSFHGKNGDSYGNSMYKYGSNSDTKAYFLPEATITYTASSASTCPKPTDLSVPAATITSSSAQVTWATEAATTNLQYKAGTADWVTVEGVSSPYNLAVVPETDYQVKVQAVCGPEDASSYTSAFAFTSLCGAMPLPFEEDFSSALSSCWTKVACHADSKVESGRFKFRYNTTPPQYLITPELNTDGKAVTVDFMYNIASSFYPESFQVGYSTTTNDVSAFTYEEEVTATNTSALPYSTTFPAETKYVVIRYNSNDMSALYVDNLRIAAVPSCMVPTDLAATAVTANSATLTWAAGQSGDDAWVVEYSTTSDFSSDVHSFNASVTSQELSGLAAQTTYYARVKTNCGANGESEYSEAISFTTACGAVASALSWSDGFEDYAVGSATSTAPGCWQLLNANGTANTSIYVKARGTGYYSTFGKDGDNFLFFAAKSGAYGYIVFPEFSEALNAYQIKFWQRVESVDNSGAIELGYLTDASDAETFTLIKACDKTTTLTEEVVSLATVPANARLAFRYTGNSTYSYEAGVDAVSFEALPSCFKPATLNAATAITPDGATFAWTAGADETQYDYCVVASGEAADGWITLDENVRSVTLTGLAAGTYDFYVRSYCGSSDQSEALKGSFTTATIPAPASVSVTSVTNSSAAAVWTAPSVEYPVQYQYALVQSGDPEWSEASSELSQLFESLAPNTTYTLYVRTYYNATHVGAQASASFTTLCDPIEVSSVAYVEHFETFPECWDNSEGTTTNPSYRWSSVAGGQDGKGMRFEGTENAYGRTNVLASPLFTMQADADLTFYWKNAKTGTYTVQIAVDGGAREDLLTGLTGNNEWQKAEVSLGAYKNHTIQLFFLGTSISDGNANLYLDELAITPQACRKPATLSEATNITSEGATLSWTAGGADSYQYAVAPVGTAEGDLVWIEINALTVTLSSLEASTTYDFYVRTYCDEENQSEARKTSFKTGCGIYTGAYEESFGNTLPDCWTATEATYTWAPYQIAGANYCVRFDSYMNPVGNQAALTTAQFRLDEDAALKFLCKNKDGGPFTVDMYVVEDDATVELFGDLSGIADWEEKSYNLSDYEGKTVYFTFYGTSNEAPYSAGVDAYLYIDDFRLVRNLALADNTNNTTLLVYNEGKTLDVQIGRTFACADYYNTICLPFDLPTLDGTPLEGGELWAFKYAAVDASTDELLFRIIEAESIEAGVPYFIAFPAGENIVNPTFKNVTISAITGKTIGDASVAQLCGIIEKPVVFAAHDHTKLFLAANNTLYWWDGDEASQLNDFRAYFLVNTTSGSNIAPRHGMPARLIKEEQVATGVEEVQSDQVPCIKVIENGCIVIIKNGEKYTIQGQKL